MTRQSDDFQAIYIRKELHSKIKWLAALNDVRMRDLASELIKEILRDDEKTKEIVKKLRLLNRFGLKTNSSL